MERLDKYPIVQARFRALGPPSKSWVVKSFPSKSFLLSRPLSLLSLLSPVRPLGTVRSPGQSGPDAQTFRRSPDSPAGHPGMSERGEGVGSSPRSRGGGVRDGGGLLEPYEDEEKGNQQAIVCPSGLGPTGRSNEEFSQQSSPPPSASGPTPRSQGLWQETRRSLPGASSYGAAAERPLPP